MTLYSLRHAQAEGRMGLSSDRGGSPTRPKVAGDDEQEKTSSFVISQYCLLCLLFIISCSGKKSGSTAAIGSVSQSTEQNKTPTTSPTSDPTTAVPALVDAQTNGTNLTSTLSDTTSDIEGDTTTSIISPAVSMASTTTTIQQLSDLNQLNFSSIPTTGGNEYCAPNQYVSANQCKTRDYVDIAAGNASVTCALRGSGSTMHCVSTLTYAIFSDPWQKAPYVPGTLNVGGNHVCAMSASDKTYYCWGYWGYESDTTRFWDTFSCSDVYFKVESDYSAKNTTGVTKTTVCKASRKQKGSRFLSTGDTNCEVVNGAPICAGSQASLSSADTNSFLRLSAFAATLINPDTQEQQIISHTCTVHQDASVTCNYNGTPYTPYLPSDATIKTNTIAVGPSFGCAYITSSYVNKIGCWSMAIIKEINKIITVIVMKNSDNQFSSIKSNGSMFCAATPQNQVSCWLPPNPNPLDIPLPPTVSAYTVGNGYVCTLDATGTAGCWNEFGTSITSLQL